MENQDPCRVISQEEAKAFEEHSIRELKAANYRITMPRVQVVRALADTTQALSAYAIHDKITSSGGKIDVVSVYRILATLQEIGLIHHIGVVDGYFPCRVSSQKADRSQHLVCDRCGCIVEMKMPSNVIEQTQNQADRASFRTTKIKLEIVGLCSACQKAS